MSLVLVILLIFVLQNPTRTEIRFLWMDGRLPIGVALLFASIAGILLVAIPATGRIWQLRRGIRHNHTP
ncbi:MAG TPA: lipopolysaccharide assembly protein LapA domain-containing protein [Jiangellaceae bacterium]